MNSLYNYEKLRNQINSMQLTVEQFIQFLNKYEDYELLIYNNSTGNFMYIDIDKIELDYDNNVVITAYTKKEKDSYTTCKELIEHLNKFIEYNAYIKLMNEDEDGTTVTQSLITYINDLNNAYYIKKSILIVIAD